MKIKLLALSLLLIPIVGLISPSTASADHTVEHCEQTDFVTGALRQACIEEVQENCVNTTTTPDQYERCINGGDISGDEAGGGGGSVTGGGGGGSSFSDVDDASVPADNNPDPVQLELGMEEQAIEGCNSQSIDECTANLPIFNTLGTIINFMAALALPIIIIVLIVGGIQFSASQGNPQAIGSAKKRITNALIALVSLIFLWSFLQWIVPGNVFNSSGSDNGGPQGGNDVR